MAADHVSFAIKTPSDRGRGDPAGPNTGSVLGQGLRPQGAEPLPGADVADGH